LTAIEQKMPRAATAARYIATIHPAIYQYDTYT
jgi:hypothetical protein